MGTMSKEYFVLVARNGNDSLGWQVIADTTPLRKCIQEVSGMAVLPAVVLQTSDVAVTVVMRNDDSSEEVICRGKTASEAQDKFVNNTPATPKSGFCPPPRLLPAVEEYAIYVNISGAAAWQTVAQAGTLRQTIQELSGMSAEPAVVLRGPGDVPQASAPISVENAMGVFCSGSSLQEVRDAFTRQAGLGTNGGAM